MRITGQLGRVAITSAGVLFVCALLTGNVRAQEKTQITVQTAKLRQTFDGLGAGAIFFEGHITSLAARSKDERQEQLYDDMFARVPTRYLQLMIRETHEPQNTNDPYKPEFDEKNFDYCKHTIQIAKAALKRRPDIQLYATLYTPPPWMKTNNDPSGGGEARATIKAGMELKLAEYVWGFCAHMQKNGVPILYLSIANEPDWPHTQPGYFLTPEKHAALFKAVGEYLDKMAKKDAPIGLKVTGKYATPTSAERCRTSATEDIKALPALAGTTGTFTDTIPARSMVTYRFEWTGK